MKHTYFELKTLEKDLGVSAKVLYTLSNQINRHYRSVEIPKSDGGTRKLSVPDPLLKSVQRKISEVILSRMDVSSYARAYSYGDSPLKNASSHVNKKEIFKLDIRKFFDHVTYPLIKERVFTTDRFSESNRILLSLLCMYDESLPQGAPTSPVISNILLYEFDEELGRWCKERDISYTRYCDDMTFSANSLTPEEIEHKVSSMLKKYGLFINQKKKQYICGSRRKKITGIVVNEKLNTPVEYRKKIRQEVFFINKYGLKDHMERIKCTDSERRYLSSLLGRINYALSINQSEEFENYRKQISALLKEQNGMRMIQKSEETRRLL